jgi:hypothetical protein
MRLASAVIFAPGLLALLSPLAKALFVAAASVAGMAFGTDTESHPEEASSLPPQHKQQQSASRLRCLVDIPAHLAYNSPACVDAALGRPLAVKGDLRLYQLAGEYRALIVRFSPSGGGAVEFLADFETPSPTAEDALRRIGVCVSGVRPAVASAALCRWNGRDSVIPSKTAAWHEATASYGGSTQRATASAGWTVAHVVFPSG